MNVANEVLWKKFCTEQKLSDQQAEQFATYLQLLQEWNKKINLTTLISFPEICAQHFQDSLVLDQFVDISSLRMIADIGSGGGFPGLPLKIKYPHLFVILIEVVGKKVAFLKAVIEKLGLQGVEVVDLDWRTFLRKTDFPIDLFCARASLSVSELVRMFKPSSPYRNAELVYWAPHAWQPAEDEEQFVKREETYRLKGRGKRLVFFKL